jgi:hypothetical protein
LTRLAAFLAICCVVAAPGAASARQPQAVNAVKPAEYQHPTATLFETREASGSAWVPDLTPMFGFHGDAAGWGVMIHGNAFAQFLYEGGEIHRTSHQAGSINWFMAMARRPLGAGRFGVRAMLSLEPWSISGCGYPNLLATGEVCDGDSIHDRQHPHDLFMELAAEYDLPIGGSLRWQTYAGLAGEPALGPPGFPHRLSSMPNPIAPISHHWLDSTHISFGVITSGIAAKSWKVEASLFNGREPDEQRFDLDLARLDSFSGRVTVLPRERLALQVSAAHLEDAETGVGVQPPTDVRRITASVIYHRPVGSGDRMWATTVAYGQNSETSIIPGGVLPLLTHALMAESSLTSSGPHSVFSRLDVVGKSAHDLHIHELITEVFTVAKLQAGYTRSFKPWNGLRPGVGISFSASVVPRPLAPRYGGRVAPGIGLFFNVSPPRHLM